MLLRHKWGFAINFYLFALKIQILVFIQLDYPTFICLYILSSNFKCSTTLIIYEILCRRITKSDAKNMLFGGDPTQVF